MQNKEARRERRKLRAQHASCLAGAHPSPLARRFSIKAESTATMIDQHDNSVDRRVWLAIRRGLKCKCPNCSKGWLFHHYLEQAEQCAHCDEPLAHYNVGLFLPFVVISILILFMAIFMLELELSGHGNPLFYLYALVPLSIALPIAILPSTKGAIMGLMWAKGWSDEQDR